MNEAYRDFHREANRDAYPVRPVCWTCGEDCSGNVTISVEIDGQTCEMPVCDPDAEGNCECGGWRA